VRKHLSKAPITCSIKDSIKCTDLSYPQTTQISGYLIYEDGYGIIYCNIQKHNGWFLYQCNISGLQS